MPWIHAAGTHQRRVSRFGRRPLAARRSLAWLAGSLALFGSGCGGDAKRTIRPEYDLHSPSATCRCQAACSVAGKPDTARVSELIDMLDDDDPAVRLTAGATLKGVTGHDTGYRASSPPAERQRQQAAWRAWWAAEQKGVPAPTSANVRPAGYTGGDPHVRRP